MSKYPYSYYVGREIAAVRRKIKSSLPLWAINKIDAKKAREGKGFAFDLIQKDIPPWSSPNVWQKVVSFYQELAEPKVFEYGTGASTINHFSNLSKSGGTYLGVEADQEWFWVVLSAVMKRAERTFHSIDLRIESVNLSDGSEGINANITTVNMQLFLMLRNTERSYVNSLDTAVDVVIIDGAYRKKCVRRSLESNCISKQGLLVLMEAGRGSSGWWEGNLTGDNDYSPELALMLGRGGQLVNGNGVDAWPNCQRKSPRPISYYNPLEACFLFFGKESSE